MPGGRCASRVEARHHTRNARIFGARSVLIAARAGVCDLARRFRVRATLPAAAAESVPGGANASPISEYNVPGARMVRAAGERAVVDILAVPGARMVRARSQGRVRNDTQCPMGLVRRDGARVDAAGVMGQALVTVVA